MTREQEAVISIILILITGAILLLYYLYPSGKQDTIVPYNEYYSPAGTVYRVFIDGVPYLLYKDTIIKEEGVY